MAINLTLLTSQLGKLIKYLNIFRAYQTNVLLASGSGVDEILTQYETERYLVTGVEQQWLNQANQMASWGQALKSTFDATLQNLQLELNAPSTSVQTILPLLVTYLVNDSQTVLSNTITAPAMTPTGSNAGNGEFVGSKKNVVSQSLGYVDDQRVLSETVQLTCIKDQFSGANAGAEQFSIVGYPAASPGQQAVFAAGTLGNGAGPTITVADSQNLIQNGAFTSFTGSAPNNWTIASGASLISQEGTNVHVVGGKALKLTGDGSTTSAQITQGLTQSGIPQSSVAAQTYTVYSVGVWLRKGGTVTSGSNLQIAITGAGFSTVNVFDADPSTLTTGYQFFNIFFAVLGSFPTNLSVTVNWTSANSSGSSAIVYVANVVMVQPVAFGNFGKTQVAIFRGSADFLVGDTALMVTANNNAGVWSTAMAWLYNTQLPSTASSPTISDALCE